MKSHQFKMTMTPLEQLHLEKDFVSAKAGALSIFSGLVRNHHQGRTVVALEYEAFEKLCRREAEQIFKEAKKKFGTLAISCVHRIGKLKVSEMAIWIGVLCGHRDQSFQACRYIIDEIKARLPIWKKEYYSNGHSGWINCQLEQIQQSKNLVAPLSSKSLMSRKSLQQKASKTNVDLELGQMTISEFDRFQLVDIRELGENMTTPMPNVSHLKLPLSRVKNFTFDAKKKYLLVCGRGMRSHRLATELRAQGIPGAFSVVNGIRSVRKYFQTHFN